MFAVELRLKIVTELYMREMSAKGFYREFGGGSPTRVHQNFRTLARSDWLRLVHSEGPGGERRGGVEQFYRAIEPPIVDAESCALIPYSVRVASSVSLFKQIAPRLRGDIEASSENDRPRRDLSRTEYLLDEEGWERCVDAMNTLFIQLFEEQEDARRRAIHSGEELIRADVFLIAFQALGGAMQAALADLLVQNRREPLAPFAERLAPIFKDDVCLDIVTALNRQELSVTQFHREIGGASKPALSRRFKGLQGGGWMAKGKQQSGGRRRGAREQFYRPAIPSMNDYDPCADPPIQLSATEGWKAFESLCEEIREAMISGAFDARANRFLTWTLIRLDKQGWENVIAGIEALAEFLAGEQKRALRRMAKSGEKPIAMTVALAAFEALRETARAP
ncbi:MAG TPA: hypothetical protein VH703_01280 [Solirubrobacterales bacterium]